MLYRLQAYLYFPFVSELACMSLCIETDMAFRNRAGELRLRRRRYASRNAGEMGGRRGGRRIQQSGGTSGGIGVPAYRFVTGIREGILFRIRRAYRRRDGNRNRLRPP